MNGQDIDPPARAAAGSWTTAAVVGTDSSGGRRESVVAARYPRVAPPTGPDALARRLTGPRLFGCSAVRLFGP